ncbi:hypothetical protein PAXRUDRAFT_160802 [Paxillus rubicundulus Ve08.2h10]|uniref:F-box domain-containing protein n=1 Tax=Paxillus rubicundulus Ve08.2h10 TaxID=930991 RepID=A0A0D0CVY4_9AGAM|nr:hypothetical protein PAXRUDRAFT_160802 [Paxillus rubicundulus Ve08.2h10]
MDAQTKRSAIGTPALPPEIWDCVFYHATYVPGTLVPEIYGQSDLIGPLYTQRYQPALREALVTKRCLVRVCKQWWHLATPHLYRSIYLGRARCLSSLCNTLMQSAAGKGTLVGTRPLGDCTERLDVAIRDHAVDRSAEFDSLAGVITCLPNLSIISFAIGSSYAGYEMPDSILYALECSASSLRVVDWSNIRLKPSAKRLSELLAACPQLRILNCPQLPWSKALISRDIIPAVTMLKLHSLDPTACLPALHEDDVQGHDLDVVPTALRELIIDTHKDMDHWRDFLIHYGRRLTSIQLHTPCIHFVHVPGYLQLVAQTCPNLRRMSLSVEHFSCIAYRNLTFPPVEYFGVRASRYQSPRCDYEGLFVLLAELKTTTPSLRVVQLTDARNVKCLLRSHSKLAVRAIKRHLETPSFRIEDQDGHLLEGSCRALPFSGRPTICLA